MKRTFTCGEHPEYGGLGWAADWMRGADPIQGMGCAHDILEHPPNMPLGAESEFMALGAMLWLRGETGFFFSGTPAENAAVDFPDILERVMNGEETLKDPGKTRALSEWDYGSLDGQCQSAVRKGVALLISDRGYTFPSIAKHMPPEYRQRMVGWMRKGIRYAVRRYKHGNNEVAYLFKRMEKEFDRRLESAKEGAQIAVHVNLKQCSFRMEEVWPNEY